VRQRIWGRRHPQRGDASVSESLRHVEGRLESGVTWRSCAAGAICPAATVQRSELAGSPSESVRSRTLVVKMNGPDSRRHWETPDSPSALCYCPPRASKKGRWESSATGCSSRGAPSKDCGNTALNPAGEAAAAGWVFGISELTSQTTFPDWPPGRPWGCPRGPETLDSPPDVGGGSVCDNAAP
jgi:hypothetical protein